MKKVSLLSKHPQVDQACDCQNRITDYYFCLVFSFLFQRELKQTNKMLIPFWTCKKNISINLFICIANISIYLILVSTSFLACSYCFSFLTSNFYLFNILTLTNLIVFVMTIFLSIGAYVRRQYLEQYVIPFM